MERPNLKGYSQAQLEHELLNREAARIHEGVCLGLVVDELVDRGVSHRTIETHTGIPKSTLNHWQKAVAA